MSDGNFQIPDEYLMLNFIEQASLSKKRKGVMTGIQLISKERLEQKIKHKRTIKDDAKYNSNKELMHVAVALLTKDIDLIPEEWDMTLCNKMLRKSYKERLAIAGALIAAELDRLNFKL